MNKLFYISLVCLMAFVFVSCSDDENINSTSAVVSMGKPSMTVKENRGLFYVPVEVSGERNGNVVVTVNVKSNAGDCVENRHYIVTSKTVIIPSSKTSVNIEIKAMDDRIINTDRTFDVYITDVKGATVNKALASTEITLLDNDDIPYDRMSGEWTVTATDVLSDNLEEVTWDAELITVVDDSEEGYGSVIIMTPWRMWNGNIYDNVQHTLYFSYNEKSETATLTLKLGETMASGLNFGEDDKYDTTDCLLRSATPSQNNFTVSGSIIGNVSSDFSKVTFSLPVIGVLYDAKSIPFSYWFHYTDIVLTRK